MNVLCSPKMVLVSGLFMAFAELSCTGWGDSLESNGTPTAPRETDISSEPGTGRRLEGGVEVFGHPNSPTSKWIPSQVADQSKSASRRVWTVRASGCTIHVSAPNPGPALHVVLSDPFDFETNIYGTRRTIKERANLWLKPHTGYPGLCILEITRTCEEHDPALEECLSVWQHALLLVDVVVVNQEVTLDLFGRALELLPFSRGDWPDACDTPRWVSLDFEDAVRDSVSWGETAPAKLGRPTRYLTSACSTKTFSVLNGGVRTLLASFGVREDTRVGVQDGRPFVRVDRPAPPGLPIQELYTLPPLGSP
jgi:hypothetical protein